MLIIPGIFAKSFIFVKIFYAKSILTPCVFQASKLYTSYNLQALQSIDIKQNSGYNFKACMQLSCQCSFCLQAFLLTPIVKTLSRKGFLWAA